MINENYNNFAKYYDLLTSNIDYNKRADYFLEIINKFGGKTDILLDLACGTGKLSSIFAQKGIDVIGVDSSYEMLSEALNKNYDEGLNVLYLCQPAHKLDLYGTVTCAVCALDSINHIIDIDLLNKTFERVSLFLEPDGIFVFDCNTIYKHQVVLNNNAYIYDLGDVFCGWQNSLEDDDIISIKLDFFEHLDKDKFIHSCDSFRERAYSEELLTKLLQNNDFVVEAIYESDTFESLNNDSERAVFVCRRVDKSNGKNN